MKSRTGIVVFFDLAGFSASTDPSQVRVAQAFMDMLRKELKDLWKAVPSKRTDSPYFVLPTGDGAAVVVWDKSPTQPSREYTSFWIAGKVLVWGQNQVPRIGIRCGINKGDLDLVKDPYADLNVCGAAINVAQRIMDGAQSGQLLIHDAIAQRLDPDHEDARTDFHYHLEPTVYEVLAKHNVLLKVRNITGEFREGRRRVPFGMTKEPADRWHLQIEPPILALDAFGVRQKKEPPAKLLLKHSRIAFVGATNHQLAGMFSKVCALKKRKLWEGIQVFFLADEQLIWMPGETPKALRIAKKDAIAKLKPILSKRAKKWEILEYDQPFYFASYWDWEKPGGRIHVSPYIWGADVSVCPALDYTWITAQPTRHYEAYRDGLQHLRLVARLLDGACQGL